MTTADADCKPADADRKPAADAAAAVRGRDPIDEHVAALAAVLRGPERVRSRMLAEVRDGLTDAAADLTHVADPRSAAVRAFGSVAEVAPAFQRELSIAQARHTARAVALAAPFLVGCWYLLTLVGDVPGAAQLLAAHLGGVTAVTALLGAVALAATGALARHVPTPRRLPLVVAWAGTTASVALGVSALALTTTSVLAGNWMLSALIGALAVASHARVAASARACRTCAAHA